MRNGACTGRLRCCARAQLTGNASAPKRIPATHGHTITRTRGAPPQLHGKHACCCRKRSAAMHERCRAQPSIGRGAVLLSFYDQISMRTHDDACAAALHSAFDATCKASRLKFPTAPTGDPATEDARTKLNAATPMMQKQRISINATEATTESATPTQIRTALPN